MYCLTVAYCTTAYLQKVPDLTGYKIHLKIFMNFINFEVKFFALIQWKQ